MAICTSYGVSPSEFWELTLKEVYEIITYNSEKENLLLRERWAAIRWSTTALINIQLPKAEKVEPQKLLTFPWEAEIEQKKKLSPFSPEAAAVFDKWDKIHKKEYAAKSD